MGLDGFSMYATQLAQWLDTFQYVDPKKKRYFLILLCVFGECLSKNNLNELNLVKFIGLKLSLNQ